MKKELFISLLICGILTACTIIKKQTNEPQLGSDYSETVAGIDQDKNGIRDDIDTFIKQRYSTPAQQRAASQYAKGLQASLLVNIRDHQAVKITTATKAQGISCIFKSFPGGRNANNESVVGELLAITTNTKQRLNAYAALDRTMDSEVDSLPPDDACI